MMKFLCAVVLVGAWPQGLKSTSALVVCNKHCSSLPCLTGHIYKKNIFFPFFLIFSFNLSGKRQIRKLRGQNETDSDSEDEVCMKYVCVCVCVHVLFGVMSLGCP